MLIWNLTQYIEYSSYHITGDEGILVQKMALFGAVGEFVEGEEDWAQYVERIGHFFGANGVSDTSKKCSIPLSSIGSKAYQTLACPLRKIFSKSCQDFP